MCRKRIFTCKNGEKVTGYIENHIVKVYYKGKIHERPLSAIGETLFELDAIVQIDSIVDIKNLVDNKLMRVKIYQLETEIKYYGMGGSFYGAKTKEEIKVPLYNSKTNPIKNISSKSPIGMALMNRKIGDIVEVLLPNEQIAKYYLMNIINLT